MNDLCNTLADTGTNTWLIVSIGCIFVLVSMFLFVRINKRHSNNYKLSDHGGTLLLLFGLFFGLTFAVAKPAHASPANCGPATPSKTTAPVINPSVLELVDDRYDINNGLEANGPANPDGTNSYYGNFNIMANDHAPAGDPIDPTTVRLSGSPTQYRDTGPTYGEPAGTNFNIINPSDPEGNELGYIFINGDYDPATDIYTYNGNVHIELYDTVPVGTVLKLNYTAKTMSGKDASNTATITITLPPAPPGPVSPPALHDDSYILDSGSGLIDVLANDDPSDGSTMNSSSLAIGIDGSDLNTDVGGITYHVLLNVVNGKIQATTYQQIPAGTQFTGYYTATDLTGATPVGTNDIYASIAITTGSNIDVALAPMLVDDTYTLNQNSALLPITNNDQAPAGDSINTGTVLFVDESNDYRDSMYTTTNDGGNAYSAYWVVWHGQVYVVVPSNAPDGTQFTAKYVADTTNGLVPPSPATITVTKNGGTPNVILDGIFNIATIHQCTGVLYTGPITFNISNYSYYIHTSGTLDMSSLDLDPLTAGRQTSYTGINGVHLTADNSGNITVTNPQRGALSLFTINNTNGDSSGTGVIYGTTDSSCQG